MATKKTKKTTTKKKTVDYATDGIVAVWRDYGAFYSEVFSNESSLLKAINEGNTRFLKYKSTRYFKLTGGEIKIDLNITEVPVTKTVVKATVAKAA